MFVLVWFWFCLGFFVFKFFFNFFMFYFFMSKVDLGSDFPRRKICSRNVCPLPCLQCEVKEKCEMLFISALKVLQRLQSPEYFSAAKLLDACL